MKRYAAATLVGFAVLASSALAQDVAEMQPASESARFLFSTLLLLASAAASTIVIAGLLAREAGLVQSRSVAATCVRHIAIVALCGLASWLVGYNLIFSVEPGGFLGEFAIWSPDDSNPAGRGHAEAARWLFVSASTTVAAVVVSGALAERVKFWPAVIFIAAFSTLIFPVAASWSWGAGYLEAAWGFSDFGGATMIHACGGWAALAGAVILGPRLARFEGGEAGARPASNAGLAAVGAFLVWFGWFGLLGGAQQVFGSVADALVLSKILVNANLAACASVAAAAVLTEIIYKKVELPIVINAAIGGLVAISAGPSAPALWQAVIIGAFGGVIVTVIGPLLERLRIDDPVGAVPTHLLCGIWGTLIVPWSDESASYVSQIAGIVIVGAYVLTMSILVWTLLRYTIGMRIAPEREKAGFSQADLQLEWAARPPRT